MTESSEPTFFWVLTVQNHGGYEQNPEECDTVHIEGALDSEFIQKTNEFLTSIQMSDTALKYLIDYFSRIDRPVVLCMTGDHCPGYMSRLSEEAGDLSMETAAKETPFIIWSNYLDLNSAEDKVFSINYLMPTVLEAAGIPLSEYYVQMLALKKEVPVLTASGYYIDSNEVIHSYSEPNLANEEINIYHILEYANIMKDEKFEDWFKPLNMK